MLITQSESFNRERSGDSEETFGLRSEDRSVTEIHHVS